jgi:hypothetical protein
MQRCRKDTLLAASAACAFTHASLIRRVLHAFCALSVPSMCATPEQWFPAPDAEFYQCNLQLHVSLLRYGSWQTQGGDASQNCEPEAGYRPSYNLHMPGSVPPEPWSL